MLHPKKSLLLENGNGGELNRLHNAQLRDFWSSIYTTMMFIYGGDNMLLLNLVNWVPYPGIHVLIFRGLPVYEFLEFDDILCLDTYLYLTPVYKSM